MPRISVAIANMNGRRFLAPCLRALAQQTRPPDETVVVDSASTDGSQQLVVAGYPQVRLVELHRRPGITAAFNACIRQTQGDAIVLLNNDTEVAPGWLAALESAVGTHPGAGSFASKVIFAKDRTTINAAGDFYTPAGRPGNRGVWERDHGQYDRSCWVFGAMAAAALYRRAALEDVGPFDEGLGSYCEDIDWAFRAQLRGWRCRYVPEAVVYHHGSATGGGELASYSCGRNFPLVFVKNMPPPLYRRFFGRMVLRQVRDLVENLPHLREPAARARLRGQAAALRALPDYLGRRRHVQRTRRVGADAIERILEK
ncbi:MAG TPA: glycosyltransferase family 2 protein [Chloroflexota bacterium]